MSGIFGLVNLDGAPIDPKDVEAMRAAMAHWGPDGVRVLQDGSAAFAQCVHWDTPEALREHLPVLSADGRTLFTAEARVDNRDELFELLDIPSDARAVMPDGDVILSAYERWGTECVGRILGDWSFAAWCPRNRQLTVARDHFGRTGMYFTQCGQQFAFASDRRALLALPAVPSKLDEIHLARVMTAWTFEQGERTAYAAIRRLPGGRAMSVSPDGCRTWTYWRPASALSMRRFSVHEWPDELRSIAEASVHCRLRSRASLAVALSGGLDSGVVLAMASRAPGARRIQAYTSVPIFEGWHVPHGRVGDEWERATAVAGRYSNVDLTSVPAGDRTPLDGVRRMLAIHQEPQYAASNAFWLTALFERAAAGGADVLLTGQGGNVTLSWRGPRPRRPGGVLGNAFVSRLRGLLSPAILRRFKRQSDSTGLPAWSAVAPWRTFSPIRYQFAAEIGLLAQMRQTRHHLVTGRAALGTRRDLAEQIDASRNPGGAISAENSAFFGPQIRDPTFDVRLVEAVLRLPDEAWQARLDRWPIRRIADGLLPDSVRLSGVRGLQSADINARLRSGLPEIERLLATFRHSDRVAYMVDLESLTEAARALASPNWKALCHGVGVRLTFGIAIGLFLSDND